MKGKRLMGLCGGSCFILVLAMTLLMLLLTHQEATTQTVSGPIKIGYVDCLSGIQAVNGQNAQRATQIAEKEINEKGGILGRKLEVIYADNESDPGRGTTAVKRVIEREKVCAISSGVLTPVQVAQSKEAAKAKIPNIAGAAGGLLTEPLNPWFFRNFWRSEDCVKAYLIGASSLGLKKVAVFYVNNAWGRESLEYTQKVAPQMGLEVVGVETCEASASDVTVQAGKFKAAGAQCILQFHYEGANAALYRAKARLDYPAPIVQLPNILNAMVRLIGPDLIEGSLVCSEVDSSRPEVAAVLKRGEELFGKGVFLLDNGVGLGYGNVMMFAKAIRKVGSDDPGKIRDALETFTGEPSFMGKKGTKIRWSSTCHDGMQAEDFAWYWFRKGEYVPIAK